ncbi:helix-turn-helix transcriptional regulator [Pontibacter sp. G13]|uniref:helix-turn-helix transcriptional regulator n=1 Tax=Pontibacter sp. G13 TaxID=3074898 RepID=UPI00288C1FCA|nr:helix-turn-helix transcriptional regulator [Pontibacter sp. G13]WNJ18393.1 helix-turn-helix transcriptional regulator [Pontibacter sp. G13]
MSITSSILAILLCLGMFQGISFGVMLIRHKGGNGLANRLLAILLWVLSYQMLVRILRLFGIGYYDEWYYVSLDVTWVYGALVYFYVLAMSTPAFQFRGKDRWHLLPLVIQMGFSLFVRLQNLYWDGTRESLSWAGYWGYVVWMNLPTHAIISSALILVYVWQARKHLKRMEEEVAWEPAQIQWIRQILWAFSIGFSIVLAILLIDLVQFTLISERDYFYFIRFYFYPYLIGLSVLTYWLGIAGFQRRNLSGVAEKPKETVEQDPKLQALAERLEAGMREEHWYRDPELTLNGLAGLLGVKPYLLSKSIREVLGTKFSDYVNLLRIAEVQRLLGHPAHQNHTLLSIAFEAGFNSKSSFQRAVKKHLGHSPKELKPESKGSISESLPQTPKN